MSFHCWVIKFPYCDNLSVPEDSAATAAAVLFLTQRWKFDIVSLLSFAFISLFPKDVVFDKGMLINENL